jgi:hypothetical protein
MIIWIVLFYIANLLDILSTYLGMEGLPKERMGEKELNPVMSLFIHSKKASYTFKFGLSTVIVVLVVLRPYMLALLSLCTIMLFFVVGNNILSIYLNKKGKLSPGKFLTERLRFPKALAYLTLITMFLIASVGVYLLL